MAIRTFAPIPMRRSAVHLFFLAFTLLSFASRCEAQAVSWQDLGQIRNSYGVNQGIQCGFFWDRANGVIATGGAQFHYMKHGVWTIGQQLPYGSLVNSIRCFDGKTLYTTVYFTPWFAFQLWRSLDSGVTWNMVPSPIYGGLGGGTDNGPDVFWSYIANAPVLRGTTTARLDSMDLVSNYDAGNDGAAPWTSTDGGRTWSVGKIIGAPSWYNMYLGCGACVDKKNKLYYAAAELGFPGVFRSKDSGKSWTCLTNLPQNVTMLDEIGGIYDRTFIQTSRGLYETSDSGNTWNFIGGPSRRNSDDARFSVLGCTGQAVIAFGDDGSVWIANGWDAPDPNGLHSTFTATAQICDSARITITVDKGYMLGRLQILLRGDTGAFTLLTADTIDVESASSQIVIRFDADDLLEHRDTLTLMPIDYGSCPIVCEVTGKAHLAPIRLTVPTLIATCVPVARQFVVYNPNCEPLMIDSDRSSSNGLLLEPFDSTIVDTGTIPFFISSQGLSDLEVDTVHIAAHFEGSNLPFDTVLRESIRSGYIPSTLVASAAQIDLGNVSPCFSYDTILTLADSGCDTLRIPLSQSSPDAAWSVAPSADTMVLFPGEVDSIHIHFASNVPGKHPASLLYSYTGTKAGTVTFGLAANVVSAAPNVLLSDTGFDFGTQSICGNDSIVELSLTNAACDSVLITSSGLSGGPFSLSSAFDTVLPPQAVLHLSITYHPSQDGDFYRELQFHISRTDRSLASDTFISFHVSMSGVKDTLYSPLSAIDMGTTYTCVERDTFIALYNPGCDTVCVSNVTIVPPDFIVMGASAFCIPPSAWDTLAIESRIDTGGNVFTNRASLQMTSSVLTPLPPITLSRKITYPTAWGFHLSSPDSAKPGKTVTFIASQQGTLPIDVTALDFTLTYIDDLLGFVAADEPSVMPGTLLRTPDGMAHQSFHLASIPSDTTLATLHFYTYLTPAKQTSVALDTVTFQSSLGRPSACIATIDTTRSAFQLLSECGSQELTTVLESGRLTIDRIEPNPAGDFVGVSIYSAAPTTGTVSIVDILGRTVWQNELQLIPLVNRISIPLDNLPSGTYCLLLQSDAALSRKEFVKER